jgi:hypothetical protein
MSSAQRLLGVGVALGLVAGLLVGVGLTRPGQAAAAAPSAEPSVVPGGPVTVDPVALPPVAAGGSSSASSSTAIAYPYFGGSPGIAPDHTIVVTGSGEADLKSDGSDRAAAQKAALAAALADAKAQADAIAADPGMSISGVLSVSASVSPGYGIQPMPATGNGTACGVAVPHRGSQPGGTTTLPSPACPPVQQTLSASVTVEYSVH